MNIFSYIDHLLRNREQVITDLRSECGTAQVTRACFKVFVLLTVVYGLIMGAQSLIHGYGHGWMYSLSAGLKLPLLFLLTLAICMPLLYVLNVLLGPREQFKVILGVLISSLAVTSILLAACALILMFFMLSTKSYAFITLLNVVIFAIAGLYGVWFLGKVMSSLEKPTDDKAAEQSASNVKTIINWWLVTYGIVGTQMAWLMRPFIGSPGTDFAIFRAQESNFYITVFTLLGKLLGGG